MESTVDSNPILGQDGIRCVSIAETAVRYAGKWYKITPKPYEPERQTYSIAWNSIKKEITPHQAYIEWYASERNNAKLLYPSFRKDE